MQSRLIVFMKKEMAVLFCFLSALLQAQIVVHLKDKDSKKPVAYANIWKENKIFTTADSLGTFHLEGNSLNKNFKITAVGYKTTNYTIEGEATVYLETETIELNEAKVVKRTNKKVIKLGKAKRGDTVYAVQYDTKTAQCAKYFSNQNGQSFIDKVKFCAGASDKNRIINLLFYSVGENGEPKEVLNEQNIICRLKKGTHIVEADVSKLNVEFPAEGIFVVLEHLLLEQNKNYSGYNHPDAFFYEPSIAIDYCDGFKDTWHINSEGQWEKNVTFSVNIQIITSD